MNTFEMPTGLRRGGARAGAAQGRCARVAAGLLLWAAAGAAAGSAGAAELRWHPPIDLARGAGERGPWQQNDSRYDFVDDGTVAWSPRGELAVAWVDQRRKDVLLQRRSAAGQALGAPVNVSRTPATFSWLPRLAWAPDDGERLYVLWQEIVFSGGSHGGEIFFAASSDGGRSFGPVLNLSRSREGDGKGRIDRETWHNGSLDIAAGPGGRVLAAWTEYDGRLWVARSTDGGRGFSRPLRVAGEPPQAPARAPSLALGRDRAVALAWATGDDPAGDIHVALSDDGGARFTAPRRVAATPGYSDAPKLAFDPRGRVLHLVHSESRGGPFEPAAIHHLRSTDGGRTFGPPRDISGPPPAGTTGAAFPSLGIDGSGRVVVMWEQMRGARMPFGLAMAVSKPDGERFGAPQAIEGSADPRGGFNGSSQGLLMNKLAVRADGEVAVVNSALRVGSHSRVWLMRGAWR